MAPLPPCWCRCYPAGTIFSGWESSVLQQETKISNMLDTSARQHTASCLREREYYEPINIIAYDRSNDAPRCKKCNGDSYHPSDALHEYCGTCLGTGRDLFAVRLWRWKTKPLFLCYFLWHRWEIVTQDDIEDSSSPSKKPGFRERQPITAKKYLLEVCQCGAERLTLHHSVANENYDSHTMMTEKWDEVWTTTKVTNRTAAYEYVPTHSRGPG